MKQWDLNEIKVFVKVVESGSFTKAAALLAQPKSRVSRRVASLEKDLGVQLIYRTTRQLQLTDSGRIFFERCAPMIRELESATDLVGDFSQEVSGIIRLTAPADMASVLVPEVLNEFMAMYPKVHFQVMLSQEVMDLVKESIDVAIRISPLRDSTLRVRKISEVHSLLVVTPEFLQKQRDPQRLEDLSTWPALDFQVRKAGQWRLYKGTQKVDLKVKPVFSCNNPLLIKEMVLAGKGVALLPEFLCQEELRRGQLVQILKPWQGENVVMNLVMPGQKEISLKVKRFADFAVRKLRERF